VFYAATRVERAAAEYLAGGVLGAEDVAALRTAVNAACRALGSGGRAAPAVKLCDAWGIPDHLLEAPIAFDWRKL
jgi:acyl-CoA oxidase